MLWSLLPDGRSAKRWWGRWEVPVIMFVAFLTHRSVYVSVMLERVTWDFFQLLSLFSAGNSTGQQLYSSRTRQWCSVPGCSRWFFCRMLSLWLLVVFAFFRLQVKMLLSFLDESCGLVGQFRNFVLLTLSTAVPLMVSGGCTHQPFLKSTTISFVFSTFRERLLYHVASCSTSCLQCVSSLFVKRPTAMVSSE